MQPVPANTLKIVLGLLLGLALGLVLWQLLPASAMAAELEARCGSSPVLWQILAARVA